MVYIAIINVSPFALKTIRFELDNLDDVLSILRTNHQPVIVVIEQYSKKVVWKSNLYDGEQHRNAWGFAFPRKTKQLK